MTTPALLTTVGGIHLNLHAISSVEPKGQGMMVRMINGSQHIISDEQWTHVREMMQLHGLWKELPRV